MTDNIYHQTYVEAILANRELGGQDSEVPPPFQLSQLEKYHFDILNELNLFRAREGEALARKEAKAAKAEAEAHKAGRAKEATIKPETGGDE